MSRLWIVAAVLLVPATGTADYLYSAFPKDRQAFVEFVVDDSAAMDETDADTASDGTVTCAYGTKVVSTGSNCRTRRDVVLEVLEETIRELDGFGVGLLSFGRPTACNACTATPADCGMPAIDCTSTAPNSVICPNATVTNPTDPTSATSRQDMMDKLAAMRLPASPSGTSAFSVGYSVAKTLIEDLRNENSCRNHLIILLTAGGDCSATASSLTKVFTRVIGFGKTAAAEPSRSALAALSSTAQFPQTKDELDRAIQRALASVYQGYFTGMAPVIGTVPQARSEASRVAKNLMIYTAFEMPGYQGHVFGIRLFEETKDSDGAQTGNWEFTDLRSPSLNLDDCGVGTRTATVTDADGATSTRERVNPCVFDAGQRLYDRVRSADGKARNLYVGRAAAASYYDANGVAYSSTTGNTYADKLARGLVLKLDKTPLSLAESVAVANLRTAFQAFKAYEPMATLYGTQNEFADGVRDRVASLNDDTSDAQTKRAFIAAWLHGEQVNGTWTRTWPLGDPYHGGGAIVEAPPYPYRTLNYPKFKTNLKNRPAMLYVPTNDGMIHAFHAGPDLEMLEEEGNDTPDCAGRERWCPGDEAWAYLPASMLAKTANEVLQKKQRFFSMDLSCRVDDVLYDQAAAEGCVKGDGTDTVQDPDDPKLCGWRSILLCAQGWGGNWLVALDVSDPVKPDGTPNFRPLWEGTYGDGDQGFGRTWSLPAIALLKQDGKPVWAAVGGGGYNADLSYPGNGNSKGTSTVSRYFNLPFPGAYPHHGTGARDDPKGCLFVQDLRNGKVLRRMCYAVGNKSSAIVADVPVVDTDKDGYTDTAYFATWEGRVSRVSFGRQTDLDNEAPASWRMCAANNQILTFQAWNSVGSRPTVMVDPARAGRVYLIAASGIDAHTQLPDEAKNLNASYDLKAVVFDESINADCPGSSTEMCTAGAVRVNGLFTGSTTNKTRLMGAPILAAQPGGVRWLSFTTWYPPANNECDTAGTGSVYCAAFSETAPGTCNNCGSMTTAVIENISDTIPPSPASADGQIYVVNTSGVGRLLNQSGAEAGVGGTAARPNQHAPRQVIVSWREIFGGPPVATPAAATPPPTAAAE